VIDMVLLSVIRRWHLRDSIREICTQRWTVAEYEVPATQQGRRGNQASGGILQPIEAHSQLSNLQDITKQ
jgi:hypothetical protein